MARSLLGLLGCIAAALAVSAQAEQADRDKPTRIDAAASRADDLKQVVVFTGDVVLSKGTLRITGERLEFREDPEGYQFGTVTAAPGKLATFRQRRDPQVKGIEEYVDAVADRMDYDGKAETIKLIGHAVVRRLENGTPRDETAAGEIVYDVRNARATTAGSAKPGDGGGRTTVIIAPRQPAAQTPAPAPAVPLQPARQAKP